MVYSAGLKYRWNIFFFLVGYTFWSSLLWVVEPKWLFSGLWPLHSFTQKWQSYFCSACLLFHPRGTSISRTWSRLESETNNGFFCLVDGTRSSNPRLYLPYLSMETSTSTYLSLWWHYSLQVRTDSSRSKIVGPIYNICYMYYQKQMVYGSLSFPESLKQVRFPVILCLHY